MSERIDEHGAPGHSAGDKDHASDNEAPGRWQSLPPRVRLTDTIASQETPPKPEVITTPKDLLREATMEVGG